MPRRYTVRTHGPGRRPITEVTYDNGADALNSFEAALSGAGHTQEAIESALRTFTLALMGGAWGSNFLDPDLTGSTEIQISVSTQRPAKG